jgi:hypothetical protein
MFILNTTPIIQIFLFHEHDYRIQQEGHSNIFNVFSLLVSIFPFNQSSQIIFFLACTIKMDLSFCKTNIVQL